MATEVEARFAAGDGSVLAALAETAHLGPAHLGTAITFDEIDRYLDTAGGRLASARWACRLRSRGSVTRISLKGPPEDADGAWLHRRPELEGPATSVADPGRWPPSAARGALLELSGGEPLVEVVRLAQRRTERPVTLDGAPLGTLSLDAVAVEDGARRAGAFAVVELELSGPPDMAALARLATELAAHPGLVPEPRTKLEHALHLLATAR